MSAISDKLSYLDVTRSKIKDTINYTGAGITESDTFRSYARTLKDSFVDIINDGTGTLYDNFPKATDEGSNTTLNNVYEAPMELEVEGKSEQHSYSGKNYANTNKDPDWVYQNTVWTRSGSNVTVKNNTSAGTESYAFVEYYIDNLKPNTTYSISFDATAVNNGYTSCDIMKVRNSSDGSSQLLRINGSTSGHFTGQFTTPADTSTMSMNLYSLRGTYYENASVEYSNIQIEEGSSETSYEPYVGGTPSPNPDYPQEIKSVSGIGNILPNNATTTTINGVTLTVNDDKSITLNGTATANVHVSLGTINVLNGEILTISGVTGYTSSTLQLFTGSVSAFPAGNRLSCSDGSKTVTAMADENNLDVGVYVYSGNTFNNVTIYPMIEKGSVAHQYVPYGHWLPVKVSNKNLLNSTLVSGSGSGLTWTVNEDKSVTINGTNTSGATRFIRIAPNFTLPAGTYTLSNENTNVSNNTFIFYDDKGRFPKTNISTVTFTQNTEIAPYIKITSGATVNNETIYPMIEQNSTATKYIEHQEQTTLIDLNKYDENNNIVGNYEICSIGDTKDLLTIKDGRAVLNKNIGKLIFDGTENWNKDANVDNDVDYFYISNVGINRNNVNRVISNYFTKGTNNIEGFWATTAFCITINKIYTGITSSDTKDQRIDKFKSWLSTHNTELYYALETPETITLKGTYDVKTYEDITHISIDDDLEPNMIASGLTWE